MIQHQFDFLQTPKQNNNTKLSSSLGFKDSVETSILFSMHFKCTYLRSDWTCLLFSPGMVATGIRESWKTELAKLYNVIGCKTLSLFSVGQSPP